MRIVAVEPDDALHGLEGLKHMGSSIVPDIWRPSECVDEILPMPTEEASLFTQSPWFDFPIHSNAVFFRPLTPQIPPPPATE